MGLVAKNPVFVISDQVRLNQSIILRRKRYTKSLVIFPGYSGWSAQLFACRKDGQYAAFDQVLRCLSMFHKMDARLIWAKVPTC